MNMRLEKKLLKRQQGGNFRCLETHPSSIDFSSNDYLGLARSPKLAKNISEECSKQLGPLNGWGATGSRLLSGNSTYAEELEDKIARFHGYEAGLLFNCGYMANLGLLSAIADENDTIIFDAAIHASTRDGIKLSRAKALPFRHNNLDHLEHRLKNHDGKGNCYICIESIYSTDGSCAPLNSIHDLMKLYHAHLIVDEAHAIGVCGPEGRGLIVQNNLTPQIFAQIVTFGKALGTYGAIVLGSNILRQALINFATPYIYTTALPFHVLAAIQCSYTLFPKMNEEREHLQKLIKISVDQKLSISETQIQSIPIRGNVAAREVAIQLQQKGFDTRALLSPTVRRGNELLRICLHAYNTENELTTLIDHLKPLRS